MMPAARTSATRAPATPSPTPAAASPPAPARAGRRPAPSGPPALRLAEPAPARAASPAPAEASAVSAVPAPAAAPVPAPPQRPAESQREESAGDSVFWGFVRTVAPDLEPILRRGIFGWLEDQITDAIKGFVDGLFAPVRAVTGVAATLTTVFQSLLEWMQEAAAKIAKGDCSSITEAVEKIEQVLSGIMSAVADKIGALATKVGDFFTSVWNRFGAPIWEMLQQIGGAAWNRIQQLGRLIWDRTEPLRSAVLGMVSGAWKWIKTKLGIGEGPEGQNGLVQWVRAKAEEVWTWLKPRIEPYKKQLMVIAGILLWLSPAGPFLAIGAGVAGVIYGVKWIREHLRKRDDVVAQRGVLERTIIPALMRGMEAVTGALKPVAARVTTKVGEVVGALSQFAGSLASSLLSFATRIIEWVGEQFSALWKWASEKLTALVEWVTAGLARLKAFLQPVLDVLRKVGEIYLDILKIPVLAATKVWNLIPACIRDPFVDFLINQVLKRIPLFKQVTELLPAMWQKIKAVALPILRKVFKEGKLKEAALDVLMLLLDALQVPLELVQTVIAKGKASIDLILDKPLEFLTNMLAALKQGAIQFGERIVDHLLSGLKNWLFAAAVKAGLHPPTELTFRAVFDFILEVLDLTVDKVLARLELKIGPEKTAKIKKALTVVSKIWEWVSTLLNEGPAGVWKKLTEKLGDLWQGVIDAAVDYITKTVTKTAIPKLTAMVAGGPIGAVINGLIAIWKALQTFAKYFKQILEIMNGVFDTVGDIARGAIGGAANMVENLMDRVLPIMIAFLANQISLGDISERIEKMLVTIREKVVVAIDWLLDKALAIGGAILNLVKAGIAKVLEWWKEAKKFQFDGKEHILKFQGDDADAELVVESSPAKLLGTFLTERKAEPMDDKQQAAFDEIKKQKSTIDAIKKKTKGGFGKEDGEKIKDALTVIAAQLAVLDRGNKLPPTALPPPEQKTRAPLSGDTVGEQMVASPLTLNPGGLSGSQPFKESALWKDVNRRPMTYVQGHLLNHHVHGPGDLFNMAPITRKANTLMESRFESDVKKAVLTERKVIEYRVTMHFNGHKPRIHIQNEAKLPTEIEMQAYPMVKNPNGKWVAEKLNPLSEVTIPNTLGPDTEAGIRQEPVNLSEDTPAKLQKHPDITPDMAQAIRELSLKRKAPFHVYDDLLAAGLTAAEIKKLQDSEFVSLR
jgi:phage-related protein